MHVLNAQQIRAADAYTIANEPIASVDLMERAATACTDWLLNWLPAREQRQQIHIVCGTGNNGGDGLVMARLLHKAGYPVEVTVVRLGANASPDFQMNFERSIGS